MRSAKGQLLALCIEQLGGRLPEEIHLPMERMADVMAYAIWKSDQYKRK